MAEIDREVLLQYQTFEGSLPIRLLEDPTSRMLREGDVIKFIGDFKFLTGTYTVREAVTFSMRKASYNYNGTFYPLILAPNQVLALDMTEFIPIDEDVIQQYRIGIPDGIVVYLAYPKGNLRFSLDRPEYRVNPSVIDDRAYIGAYTSVDSPFDEPRLEVTNVFSKEDNVYLVVKNDSPTYMKALLNITMNKIRISKGGNERNAIPFYHGEVIP